MDILDLSKLMRNTEINKSDDIEREIGRLIEREHIDTINAMRRALENGQALSDAEIIDMIVSDHLKEDAQYYTKMFISEYGEEALNGIELSKIDWKRFADKGKKSNDSMVKNEASDNIVMSGPGALMLGKEFMIKGAEIPFSFTCDILKAEEIGGKMYVRGVASDNREDREGEIISENALSEMVEDIKSGKVSLLPSHKSDWDDEIGRVVDAKIIKSPDGGSQLEITAELDPDSPKAKKLYNGLMAGKQLGLSIGGMVKKVFSKFVGALNKAVKVIDSLELRHIAVTGRPANPRTWLTAISKSIDEEVGKMTTKENIVATGIDEYAELVKAIKSGDAKAIEVAKEALKKCMTAKGQESDFDAMVGRAQEEANKAEKSSDAEIKKSNEDDFVIVKMTKEQAAAYKAQLEKEAAENDPVIKSLKGTIANLIEKVENLEKAVAERKAVHKTYSGINGDSIEKVAIEFVKEAKGAKTEDDLRTTFKGVLGKALGIR